MAEVDLEELYDAILEGEKSAIKKDGQDTPGILGG